MTVMHPCFQHEECQQHLPIKSLLELLLGLCLCFEHTHWGMYIIFQESWSVCPWTYGWGS